MLVTAELAALVRIGLYWVKSRLCKCIEPFIPLSRSTVYSTVKKHRSFGPRDPQALLLVFLSVQDHD
jgi:hypothetical protein